MLLMQAPQDIHLSIIAIGDFSINELKSLSFTCRHFAYPCLSEKCKNLKELMLRFSQKKRKNRAHLLPLRLLGDRLINLSIVTYEHLDHYDDDGAQVKQENKTTEFSSLVNGGQQILKQMYNYCT